jgi:hypothetical protein
VVFEESPDGFMARWREHAASVHVFSRTEGLPLLECEAGGAILQMLERTGPYIAPPGNARVIINPTAARVQVHGSGQRSLEATGIGQLRGCGLISRRDDPFLVIDAGAPLVLGVQEELPAAATAGMWVSFEAVPPIHAFVVREVRAAPLRTAEGEAP